MMNRPAKVNSLSVNGPAMENNSFIARREWSLTTWCEKPNSYASFSKSLREILLNLRMFSARFLAPLSRTSNVEMPRTSMKYRTHK